MVIIIGSSVAAVLLLGYAGRKSWLALHRVVGITPGRMVYIEPSQLPPPTMVQLQLTPQQLQHIPPAILEQLTRIDSKADSYQSWQGELEQAGQTPVLSEEAFIVSKLLSTRLPEMIDSYQHIARHERQLHNIAKPTVPIHNTSNPNHIKQGVKPSNYNNATMLLMDLLQQTEDKLDSLLQHYQSASLQDMQVMRRYLNDR